MAEAKRRMRRRRLLILAAALLVGGAATGAALTQGGSSGFQAAAVCPAAGSYVYEVPNHPGQAPTAPAWPPGGNDSWAWTPRWHALQVGNWVRADGRLWRVSGIAALPGDCKFFAITGVPYGSSDPHGGSLAGRLVLQPVA